MAQLRMELLEKTEELAVGRALNYELTTEFDQAVNSICNLEKELSGYRIENNELKKSLSLWREQQRCQELEEKYAGHKGYDSTLSPDRANCSSIISG